MQSQKKLKISFHGRIIEHLGIQMYQKPIAAIAEMVSNAWDADAEVVSVDIPVESILPDSMIVITDDGRGMTFEECESKFLSVGRSRRGAEPDEVSPKKKRPVLGRKGIGKFAGFGIADQIEIETISEQTGERTLFILDAAKLITDDYISEGGDIEVLEYEDPNELRKKAHGTKITLKNLKLQRKRVLDSDLKSMSRRFLLAQRSDDFEVKINGQPLPDIEPDKEGIEFVFPEVYSNAKYEKTISAPDSLTTVTNGWGADFLPSGQMVRWKMHFYKTPIQEDELRGLSIYSKGKLAQSPFFFNVAGGLSGQHGQQYVSGQVEADFIDSQTDDLISPERQRVNWDNPLTLEFEEWGKQLVKKTLSDWKKLRQAAKVEVIHSRIADFSSRLNKMQKHERKTIESAINKVASVESLDESSFMSIGDAMLTAWEKGRLQDLIANLAEVGDMPEQEITSLLLEARILSALSSSEAIATKLATIEGLRKHVQGKTPENSVRDYIAEDPWLISPTLDFFKKETQAKHLIDSAKNEAKLDELEGYKGRVDLALSNGTTLVIIEFMRPGLTLDWDHVSRFKQYVNILKTKILNTTGLEWKDIKGYIIADKLGGKNGVAEELRELEQKGLLALDWQSLIEKAAHQWKDYQEAIILRTPEDERLSNQSKTDAEANK